MKPAELEGQLAQYLAYRESFGSRIISTGILKQFVRDYATEYPGEPIQVDHVLDWVIRGRRSPNVRSNILGVLRGFLRFVRITDPSTAIPDSHLLRSPIRTPPFIWSVDQLQSLLTAARNSRPHRGLRAHALASALGLMASSGLRVGETLRLQVADVRLDDEIPHLIIRETKFKKSRIVPLHPTTTARLKEYATRRAHHCRARHSHIFFVTDGGCQISRDSVEQWFAGIANKLGLRTPGGKRPSPHSLRHTFAVHRLTQWYIERKPVWELIPVLSIYLGHVSPSDTYWYISSTPELLSGASDRFGSYSASGESL